MCCAFTVPFLQPIDFVAVCLFVIISDCCLLQKMSDLCICEPFFPNYNLVCNNLLEIKLTGVHMLYLCIFWLWWIKCVVCCLGPPLSKSEEALSFDWLLKDKSNSLEVNCLLDTLWSWQLVTFRLSRYGCLGAPMMYLLSCDMPISDILHSHWGLSQI